MSVPLDSGFHGFSWVDLTRLMHVQALATSNSSWSLSTVVPNRKRLIGAGVGGQVWHIGFPRPLELGNGIESALGTDEYRAFLLSPDARIVDFFGELSPSGRVGDGMRKHRLLLLVLLATVACRKTPEPRPASLPPNTLRFVQSPVLRASDEEQVTRLGVRSWLVFEKDGMPYEATWEERGKTRPVALDPDLTYEFTITWLGWHIDMCQVVSIRQGGRLIWENPDSWLGKTAHGK